MTTTTLLAMIMTIPCQAKLVQLYGINYTPRKGPDWAPELEKCKTPEEITADLTTLSTITSRIRIYSLIDCNQGQVILDIVQQLNLQVMLGLWVGPDPKAFENERAKLAELIESEKIKPETVVGISAGSEAIYREEITASASITNLESIQVLLQQHGLQQIPVSVVDIIDTYDAHPELLAAGGAITANAFPFWERKPINEAVGHLVTETEQLLAKPQATNRKFILTETGWASGGSNGAASEATPSNQAQFFQNFYCGVAIGHPEWGYYYFSGIDDAWRLAQDEDTASVEGHFGIFDGQRVMKPEFAQLQFTCAGDTTETTYTMLPTGDPDFDNEDGPIIVGVDERRDSKGNLKGDDEKGDDDKGGDDKQNANNAGSSFVPFPSIMLGISSLILLCM